MQIDVHKIESELQELAGDCRVKVKLDKQLDIATSIREYEIKKRHGFDIKFNPNKFRNQAKLEEHLNFCRETVSG